ncbi:PREDICTED: uncharacterized protein At3g03773 isoform X1 [Lupinus angustifolius]|uniref:uncharacterized protein At3g03773 isoform X1 n=1 Tax=Lupinus angustifolius TaxID=3871 RepID=UPI00092EB97D|nr:PREDICTED: uncharacterized protein At3g03773 isoform X1 [Lupinus angustifolius]
MSRHPEVLWAQRSDKVYLTIALPDAKDVSIKCEPHGLFTFSASHVQGDSYSFTLELYGPISPEGCKNKTGLRNILCSVQKAQKGWWKRLLKSEEKPAPYLKVDWHRWCDEDDEESASFVDLLQLMLTMMMPGLPVKMVKAVMTKECYISLTWKRLECSYNKDLSKYSYDGVILNYLDRYTRVEYF